MKLVSLALSVSLLALMIGCGGSTDSTATTTTASTTGTTATTTTGGGTSISLTSDAGTYTGTLSGTRSGTTISPYSYTGTGSLTIQNTGAATLSYQAKVLGSGLVVGQSFTGTVTASGTFSGTTPIAPSGGGPVQNLNVTGTVSQVSSTQLQVVLNWSYPFTNGGTLYAATDTFNMTLQ